MLQIRATVAVLFGVLAIAVCASSASAVEVHFCKKVGGTRGGFANAACSELVVGGGEYAFGRILGDDVYFCEKPGGETHLYGDDRCTENLALPVGKWEHVNTEVLALMLGTSNGSAVLKGTVSGDKVKITCTSNTFMATGEEAGKTSAGKIEYSGCTVTETNKCKVAEPIVAEFTGQTATGPVIKFTGDKAEETFAEVLFENKATGETCALKGVTAKAKGAQTCSFDAAIESFAEEHEVICKTTGSELLLGGKAATYEGNDKVMFKEGYPWNVS